MNYHEGQSIYMVGRAVQRTLWYAEPRYRVWNMARLLVRVALVV
jgi:hypothetical protein